MFRARFVPNCRPRARRSGKGSRDNGTGSIIPRGDAWYLHWYVADPLTGERVWRRETLRETTNFVATKALAAGIELNPALRVRVVLSSEWDVAATAESAMVRE